MRRLAIDGAMEALSVVIIPEFLKLPLQVRDIPEQRLIGILTPDRPNPAFTVGMGNGRVGNGLDFLNARNAPTRPPSVEAEERIVTGT
ncbi:MAG: hypothetical protein ACYDHM_13615 [Acidiferrobacterales bacterium]